MTFAIRYGLRRQAKRDAALALPHATLRSPSLHRGKAASRFACAAVQLFMTPIVAKEIRLLLPAYVMALLLAILPIWLLARLLATTTVYDQYGGRWTNAGADAATIFPFFFGTVILALSSLGREFALGPFPLL